MWQAFSTHPHLTRFGGVFFFFFNAFEVLDGAGIESKILK
ncbi:hypothetical protein AB42_5441 [Escherichia coli 1-392-07_S1_C2]|nr:hypothetical protein AB42_5441 [Escherichia coli 1-392-07_S1_C2]